MPVRRMEPHEWQLHKQLRLAALKDAPTAFGSAYETEAAFTDEQWQQRAARLSPERFMTLFGLSDAGDLVGLATCFVDDADPLQANLVSMWVSSAARGCGLGRLIVSEAVAWARSVGCRRVILSVTIGNTAAERLYASLGFIPTGVTEKHRRFPELFLRELAVSLPS